MLAARALGLLSLAACAADGAAAPDAPMVPDAAVVACAPVETAVPNEGWAHVAEGTLVSYAHNPPASGMHYPRWTRYQEHATPIPRGYWVHNLEHGAIVLLYRPDAPAAVREALVAAYAAIPDDAACGHKRALLTPDPLLDAPVAVVAANVVLESDCVSAAAIQTFVSAHRNAAPENVCAHGTAP